MAQQKFDAGGSAPHAPAATMCKSHSGGIIDVFSVHV